MRVTWVVLSLAAVAAFGCNNDKLTAGAGNGDLGEIAGRVCSPSGDLWLSGAQVWVVRPDQSLDQTTTDTNGNFLLGGVAPGSETLYIQKGSFSTQQQVNVVAGQTTTLPTPACVNGSSAKVAVVTGNDSIQSILVASGITDVTLYGSASGTAGPASALLGNPTLLATYDIVFLNCADYADSTFSSTSYVANIAAYVAGGGALYTSDWAYDFIDAAFPGEIHFFGNDSVRKSARAGVSGHVTGSVAEAGLAQALGHPTLDVDYSVNEWAVALSAAADAKILVTGNITAKNPSTGATTPLSAAPLAIEFRHGNGSVVYTSFHNEAQVTSDMSTALHYMVFEL